MQVKPTLSVVIPTYNCAPLMVRHLASMEKWAHLADEIIIVDSRSTDGTLDLIRARLRHPNLRIIERDRGLYESWNEGIAATTGKWVYVSTVGDLISEEHLRALMREGERAAADAVVSPQRFVAEDGAPYQGGDYANAEIHDILAGQGVVVLSPAAVCYFAFRKSKPNALLGSWASDLFRGEFLRARPLPTEYGTHGDTAWTLRHSAEMRLCLMPIAGADFCIHAKEPGNPGADLGQILQRMFTAESARVRPLADKRIAELLRSLTALFGRTRAAKATQHACWYGSALRARNRLAWIPASFRYLFLHMRRSYGEACVERALRPSIRRLA